MPATADTLQDLSRIRELSAILMRHGLGELLHRMGLDKLFRRSGAKVDLDAAPTPGSLTTPERLRLAFEEMGPTFTKLGQILATRVDLLPPDYIAELSKLHSQVPAVPLEALAAEVEPLLGQPLATAFDAIDPTPIGGGSIAQVHRAQLKSGEPVVLKIRRPGVAALIESDLHLLFAIAEFLAEESNAFARFRPRDIVTEFARSIRAELDLVNEAHNAERIATNFRDDPTVYIPQIYWDYTNVRMNVQEVVPGLPATDLDAVRAAGIDLKAIADVGVAACLKMMLEDGFFHADPHPGNVFFLPGNTVAFIDFGMVGRLSRQRREELVDLLQAVIDRRADRATRLLLDWSGRGTLDAPQLQSQLDGFIDRVHGVALERLNVAQISRELMDMVRAHELSLPSDLTVLLKALTSLEGLGRSLDPGFDLVGAIRPFISRMVLLRFDPARIARDARDSVIAGAGLAMRLPEDLSLLLRALKRGELHFGIDVRQMGELHEMIERSVTRLVAGLVISALIMGSSIVMTATGSELPGGLVTFAMLGFFGAALGGLWLLWTIFRSSRK